MESVVNELIDIVRDALDSLDRPGLDGALQRLDDLKAHLEEIG